jgi:DNA (cytosine-5)-methyltransferase 1
LFAAVAAVAVTGRVLDLFCGAGGAAVGYHRAGFEVVGVDIARQERYPFAFHHADAIETLRHLRGPGHIHAGRQFYDLDDFDAIHASPPCQHFTAYGRAVKDIKDRYEDLLEPTRELLEALGLPYVIENVEGAPLKDAVVLCGSMFDLDVKRHRLFEANWELRPPEWGCRHKIWSRRFKPASNRTAERYTIEVGSWDEPLERQKAAMGVDWEITTRELSEAIPPAYTEFIGRQLRAAVDWERRAA